MIEKAATIRSLKDRSGEREDLADAERIEGPTAQSG
jgi:hypothetical protein